MKKFAIKINTAAVILLLLFGSCLFSSCSSMKKTKTKTDLTIKKEENTDSLYEVQTEIVINTQEKVNEVTEVYNETEEICVESGDSLEVTTYDANGKKTGSKKYKGSGKSKTTKEKSSKQKQSTTDTKQKTDSNSKTELSKRSAEELKLQEASLEKKKQGFSFWNYLFWLVLIILIYLNYRFKLIRKVFNHVRNVFTAKDTLAKKE